jgi:hypothetical protein
MEQAGERKLSAQTSESSAVSFGDIVPVVSLPCAVQLRECVDDILCAVVLDPSMQEPCGKGRASFVSGLKHAILEDPALATSNGRSKLVDATITAAVDDNEDDDFNISMGFLHWLSDTATELAATILTTTEDEDSPTPSPCKSIRASGSGGSEREDDNTIIKREDDNTIKREDNTIKREDDNTIKREDDNTIKRDQA